MNECDCECKCETGNLRNLFLFVENQITSGRLALCKDGDARDNKKRKRYAQKAKRVIQISEFMNVPIRLTGYKRSKSEVNEFKFSPDKLLYTYVRLNEPRTKYPYPRLLSTSIRVQTRENLLASKRTTGIDVMDARAAKSRSCKFRPTQASKYSTKYTPSRYWCSRSSAIRAFFRT